MTEAGSIVGTAQYLSPEQARGAPVDPRSDLYSLGIVLYEMLTGKVPFTGDTPVEIAMKHLSQVPEPPSTLRPDVPHDLDAVVMRALAKDPDQRYGSAEEMDADLARVARGVAVSRETEDAMTQVLAGAGSDAAQTMVTKPRPVATPPTPPAYRPPTPYVLRGAAARPLDPALAAGARLIVAAARRLVPVHEGPEPAERLKAVAVPDVTRLESTSPVQDPAGRLHAAGAAASERHSAAGAGLGAEPGRRREIDQDLDRDADRLDRHRPGGSTGGGGARCDERRPGARAERLQHEDPPDLLRPSSRTPSRRSFRRRATGSTRARRSRSTSRAARSR